MASLQNNFICFNEWAGRMAGLLYALYIPSIVLSSLLTNQHIATFLFYLGFYLLITKGLTHKYMWIFIGISSLRRYYASTWRFRFDCSSSLCLFTRYIRKIKTGYFNFYKKLSGIFIVFILFITL